MATSLPWVLGGEAMELLGARALYWPARQSLLIADLHLGKADVFRRAGIALPAGGTRDDLSRLQGLLQLRPARRLWILGDVLHGVAHRSAWHQQWRQWREQHPSLQVVALHGNHDRFLTQADLGIELAGESVNDGPFLLRHEPVAHPTRHVLCGHLHPLAALPGMRRRWPSFWLRERLSVLPAFSQFTAGVVPTVMPGERMVACVDGDAVALPSG